MKKKYTLQIYFLFIIFIFVFSNAVHALETNTKATEKQSITTEKKDDLEEKSPLDKEFETVPNQTEEITTEDDDWLNQKETARDKEINTKLKKQITKTIFYLFIVIILIFLVLKFLGSGKINIPTLGLVKNRKSILNISERMFLQQGKVLYLIKAGSKNILIGVSENNINYLTELPAEENETENTNTKQETQNDKTSYFSLFPQIIPIEPKENTPKVKKEESSEE